jgi:membrane associated rhomboid family serine protease
MKYFSAAVSFLVIFIFGFFLGGWFLMPYLPPVPTRPISPFESEYWSDNWAGLLTGLVLGSLSAWQELRRRKRLEERRSSRNES